MGPSLFTNNCSDPGFIISSDSVSSGICIVLMKDGLDCVEIVDLGEQSGLLIRCIFECLPSLGCLLKDSKPEIRFRNSSDTT